MQRDAHPRRFLETQVDNAILTNNKRWRESNPGHATRLGDREKLASILAATRNFSVGMRLAAVSRLRPRSWKLAHGEDATRRWTVPEICSVRKVGKRIKINSGLSLTAHNIQRDNSDVSSIMNSNYHVMQFRNFVYIRTKLREKKLCGCDEWLHFGIRNYFILCEWRVVNKNTQIILRDT
jgi:hypothetical protein